MLEGANRTTSYYEVLGVAAGSPAEEIRRAYHKQAMRWHPDRWAKNPSLSGEAKRRFQQIQEAYSVLSDQRKRTMYDAGMYDAGNDEEDEGFFDFVQEMVSLMAQTRAEEKQYSMEELQTMFAEMIQEFDAEPLFQNRQKGMEFELNEAPERPSRMGLSLSGVELYPQSGY